MMTRTAFHEQATALCRALGDVSINSEGLQWMLKQKGDDECYLMHAPVFTSDNTTNDATADDLEDATIDTDDEARASTSSSLLQWNFSIVYSETWKVPVFYLTIQDASGTLLTQSQVVPLLRQGELASKQQRSGEEVEWISYDEHPYTRTPSCFLHPCQTASRIKLLLEQPSSSEDHGHNIQLLSWLNAILPTIGYSLDAKQYLNLIETLAG